MFFPLLPPLAVSQLREDELKTRLRSKSARVRGHAPVSSTEEDEDEDAALTLVKSLQLPLTPDPLGPPPRSQNTREAAEGGECVREAGGDGRECKEGMGRREGRQEERGESGDNRGEGAERVSENGEEEDEEETKVEELRNDELLAASGELENDSSFQPAADKDEIF